MNILHSLRTVPPRDLWAAGSIGLAAAFLLAGYEFVRSASNTLYKAAYGAENLPVIMAIMPLGVIVVLYLYGRSLTAFGPKRTMLGSSLVSALAIVGCYIGITFGSAPATGVLYIVREAYIILLIEQYWSLINSRVSDASGRILNGPICGLGSLGSILGGVLVYRLAEPLGTASMLLFAAAFCVPAALCSHIAYQRCGEPQPEDPTPSAHTNLGLGEFRNPRLRLIFIVIVLTQIISALLSIRFQTILQLEIPDPDAQTKFSGAFFAWLGGSAAFLQFIVAPILLRWFSLRTIHTIIPVVHVVTCAALTASPSLATAGAAYMVFKCFDYSLFRAAKELLYIPLSFDARYRAKEVIDVFGYRFSKGGTSLILTFIKQAGIVFTSGYSIIALIAATVWAALVPALTRKRQ